MYFQYTITTAAKHVGVSTQTLRNWEKRKLAGDPKFVNYPDVPPRATCSAWRMYDEGYIRAVACWRNPTLEQENK
jgi:hypothetical protein